MFQLTTFKENALTVHGRNVLQSGIGMMNTQFTAIFKLPIGVQVHNHRILSAGIAPELIQVFFIETPFFIHGIVELITSNSGIAGAVQVTHKLIH